MEHDMKNTQRNWKLVALASVCALAAAVAFACGPAASPPPPPPPSGGGGGGGGGACRGQVNMEGALAELRAARGHLEHAEHDKGGWRAKAVEETNVAIRETENGCAYADTH
jgi:hypothetical protein